MDYHKLVSIITVTYNCERTIENTILNILNQDYSPFELIIIDGKSTDNTLKIINKYVDRLRLYVDKDKGIYDAMNKGIEKARGEWLIFINSGDLFHSHSTLSKISNYFYTQKYVIAGSSLYKYPKKNKLYKAIPFKCGVMPASHQSIFIKSEVIKKFLFNTQYKVAADYDQMFRIYLKYPSSFLYINELISVVEGEGFSTMNTDLHLLEYKDIIQKYKNKYFGVFWFYKKILNQIIKKVLNNFYFILCL